MSYPLMKNEVYAIKELIQELEQELNEKIRLFQDETGIPILIEATAPESKYLGQKPAPEIRISAFIYEHRL